MLDRAHLKELLDLIRSAQEADPLSLAGALRRRATVAANHNTGDAPDQLRLAVAASVLADLVEGGWSLLATDHNVTLVPPQPRIRATESVAAAKARIREGLLRTSDRQIATEAVQNFLRSMERGRVFEGSVVSIRSIIDDGPSLAAKLEHISGLPESGRASALRNFFQPTIHVCDPDSTCQFTGIALLDIWRYFRHTWSLEYNALPGRTVRLLIRNKARPNWPVMGIAMLASPAANLYSRDKWIGWELEEIQEKIIDGSLGAKQVAKSLWKTIDDAIAEIRTDDLLTPPEIDSPTGPTFFKLQQIIARSDFARRRDLKRRDKALQSRRHLDGQADLQLSVEGVAYREIVENTPALEENDDVDENLMDAPIDIRSFTKGISMSDEHWRVLSETPLYRKKRAEQLLSLLRVRKVFRDSGFEYMPGTALLEILVTSRGRWAVLYALRELRKRGLASEVADLSVCGAVPPYNQLLVGKLVALLACSREVQRIYAQRYLTTPSEIASQLAGRAIVKSSELKVLTTTSLYGIGSSQYNRLRLRACAVPRLDRDVIWEELAPSNGITITHLSKMSLDLMRRLGRAVHGRHRINSVFGEGSSPRTRQIREGLNLIGINNDDILTQSVGRRVYGCELFPGARSALTGFTRRLRKQHSPTAMSIVHAWIERWLVKRAIRPDVIESLRESPADVISREFQRRAVRGRYEAENHRDLRLTNASNHSGNLWGS